MFERDISEKSVEEAVKNGKVIEEYLDDKPYPNHHNSLSTGKVKMDK